MKATHLQMTGNFNQPFVTNGFYDPTRPYTALPLSSPVLPAQCAPPNTPCSVGNITRIFSPGNSNYNALWVTLTKHLSNGLEFLAAYTYSHSLDYSSVSSGDAVPVQNVYDPRGDYGSSEFDTRHRIVVSGFYQFPFKGNRLVSGWNGSRHHGAERQSNHAAPRHRSGARLVTHRQTRSAAARFLHQQAQPVLQQHHLV